MKNMKWIFAASVLVMAASCCPCRKSKSPSLPLTGVEWKLNQMYGTTIVSDNYRITFGADGAVAGVGDCNRFAGSFTMNVGSLKIGEHLAATRMMCPNQQQEDAFLRMLPQADSYHVDGRTLMLLCNGEVIALFSPADENLQPAAKNK